MNRTGLLEPGNFTNVDVLFSRQSQKPSTLFFPANLGPPLNSNADITHFPSH